MLRSRVLQDPQLKRCLLEMEYRLRSGRKLRQKLRVEAHDKEQCQAIAEEHSRDFDPSTTVAKTVKARFYPLAPELPPKR